ncbi:biogenesis of lysosome-related organelles complex 1 subunit 6 [Labrus bergylta]|uniref:biogenesis of lysosome-related organelles complex 1 subunit 6 n=1 Tax=Labrus bergylta TaxID=56723 RepID=UPI0009B442AE|nr:biogenesis of lysosome-related organelles complex 1 subunit 6-like isoform X2 [Labrus bergylta]XP_020496893.1 biogenesis of lysosome-related organelles complex 1 subunit 6 isoform X2 [Labrus bergylta]
MEEEGMGDEGPSSQSELHQSEDQELAHQEPLPVEDSSPVENVFVDKKAVDKLTEGLLSHYLPDLQNSKRALQELTQNQLVLLDTLDQEVTKFRECNALLDLNSLFTEAKVYHNKLVNIRKEMIMLHEKTTKLKKRSLKLQQQKQKEALEKEQQREKELERERQLIAKPAKRT